MDPEYFKEKEGLNDGCRLSLLQFLTEKKYVNGLYFIIMVYFLLFAVYFVFEDQVREMDPGDLSGLVMLEVILLCYFIIDIVVHLVVYRSLYLQDSWNKLDIFVVFVNTAFLMWAALVLGGTDEVMIQSEQKIQGVFKLSRLYILIRQFNLIRKKKDAMIYLETQKNHDDFSTN